jgi:hypothetical protein
MLTLALLGSCVTRAAFAEVVVRVVDRGSPELGRKLDSELRFAGFAVQRTKSDAEAPALRVADPDRVELVLSRPGEVEVVTQTLIRRAEDGDAFALRVVEHLRARLVDLGWSLPEAGSPSDAVEDEASLAAPPPLQPPPVSLSPPPEARSEPWPLRPVPTLWLDAGVHGSLAVGGLGVTPHGVLGARLDLSQRLGLSLTGFFPLGFNDFAAEEGEAELAWHVFIAGIDYSPRLPEPWFASVGLVAGLLVIDVEGSASDDFVGQSDRLLTGVYGVELGAGRQLLDWLRLRLTVLAGVDAPRPVLRFDEREVASLGRWFGSVGISLDFGLVLSGSERAREVP